MVAPSLSLYLGGRGYFAIFAGYVYLFDYTEVHRPIGYKVPPLIIVYMYLQVHVQIRTHIIAKGNLGLQEKCDLFPDPKCFRVVYQG